MADLLVTGIGQLVTNDPVHGGALGTVADAAVLIEEGTVAWAGPVARQPAPGSEVATLDVAGAAVIPGFVDCHTHAAFAGDRADEFAMRLRGASYEEIMASGGGILSTVDATRRADDEALFQATVRRVDRMLQTGTTTVEIKSGYGLDVATERRLLQVIAKVGRESPMEVVPTFLGAHVVAPEYTGDRAGYVAMVVEEMLPACAPLARFCDVFCDRGAFTADEARTILTAAGELGLDGRLHAEQLDAVGAAELAAELSVASADHLDHVDPLALEAMHAAGTVAVLLPGVSLSM
jgi:imidazolonepropionase